MSARANAQNHRRGWRSILVTGQINASTLTRLLEGMRIYRLNPDSKLVLSGGGAFEPVPDTEITSRVAMGLGPDLRDIEVESRSKDTADQARVIKSFIGNHPFILLTSVSHIPHSMALFKKAGLKPVPAPAQHAIGNDPNIPECNFSRDQAHLKSVRSRFVSI